MFEYKFEKVIISNGLKERQDNNMEQVEKAIVDHAKDGWRLVQVLVVPKEKAGLFMINYYKIIFEREI
ncbi:DUF4177 domain-containing protein [Anaerococcus sp. DFU013_CI05]|uniref:DUF4177 domain-containing protein n=1 Tax=Anaerococcus sp. AH8042_DFU013_CI05 TaxID=3385202 RepID=UPI003A521AF0